MSPLVTTTGPADLAHLVHYGIVAAGLAGVTALLLPAFLERAHPRAAGLRRARPPGPRAAPSARAGHARPCDSAALRRSDHRRAGGATRRAATRRGGPGHRPVPPGRRHQQPRRRRRACRRRSSAPARRRPWSARSSSPAPLAQLAWAALAWRRRTPGVLDVGIAGNAAVLLLWLASRTVGIPGIATVPEPVGPWDLTCACGRLWSWSAACVSGTRGPSTAPAEVGRSIRSSCSGWSLSVLALGMLSISGAAA